MNFEKLFTDYRIPFSLKVNKGWINTNCPYCDTKINSFNMGFNPTSDYCTCWKCGNHNLIRTLSRILSIPSNLIHQTLQPYQGRNSILHTLNKRQSNVLKLELPTDTFLPIERKYLIKRNFIPELLNEKYKIVGGGISGKWKYRIIIPLIYNNKIVSWTARSILDKSKLKELDIPRYKNLSIEESVINPKEVLFNLDNCLGDTAVLTEGPFDVIRLGDGFFCSFGTSLTQSQIKIIQQRFKKIYIMFDNEVKAQDKARKVGLELSSLGVDVEVVNAYDDFNKNDGGELTPEEVEIIREELDL